MDAAGPRWEGGLLAPGDPAPVLQRRADSASPILLVCDHAGRRVPSRCHLGVAEQDLCRHIAWDLGASAVAERLSDALDAELIAQRYSRLVIDCNRPPHEPDAMPPRVDGTAVPGNAAVTPADAAARVAEVFMPYHAAIGASLDRRAARGERTVLVAVHSFTPLHRDYPGARPWPVTFLYNRLPALSETLAHISQARGVMAGLNVPYVVDDRGDYTIPVHAERRGLPSTLVEMRQDTLADDAGVAAAAALLADIIPLALDRITT
ncbi:N-formylglutamate amidohydrolase [Acuticoccus sp. I52.16.1]|uniref:N-formylglutamate amidohydrolase n=1 Tax=Acuticoccus sp. I52.16.1 TaxID=2928472 RepID=UPI001FD190FE|nr:N-formylglutamate amidohydrolase [Acuticoccus sp. I52.16.1]UOM36446.1 N-formylglutamate amidohydrolase [Acuticoccus sp. I52.16.1]